MAGLCKYGHIIIIIIVLIIASNIKRNNDNYYGIPRAPRAKSAYILQMLILEPRAGQWLPC